MTQHDQPPGQPPVTPLRRRVARVAAWRTSPAATRWSWLTGVVVALAHLAAAALLAAVAIGPERRELWSIVPGRGVGMTLVAVPVVLAALWELSGVLARRAARRSGSTVPIVGRVFGSILLLQLAEAVRADAPTSGGPLDALLLAAFGAVVAVAGALCLSAARHRLAIVDAEGRPVTSAWQQRALRGGRAALGALLVALGAACLVDVARLVTDAGRDDGVVGVGHAILAVHDVPGGQLALAIAVVLLVVCAVAAAARAAATARDHGARAS